VVHTRPDEVFALALIEALACGGRWSRRAAAARPSSWATRGVLAPPDDPAAFARLLGTWLDDAGRRAALGLAARRQAVERYSVERMVRDYADVLESQVRGRRL